MSTNWIHVLTVIGQAADNLQNRLETLVDRGQSETPMSIASDSWSEVDRDSLHQLCRNLIGHSDRLPVYSAVRYLDSWSIGFSPTMFLRWPDERQRRVIGTEYDIVFLPGEQATWINDHLSRLRRRKAIRQSVENTAFVEALQTAINGPTWLNAPFLVVAIQEVLNRPSRLDEDVRASLSSPLSL